MKKYILPFMSIAMLMAMASCSSSDDEVAEIKEESKLVPMTFTATQESNGLYPDGAGSALDFQTPYNGKNRSEKVYEYDDIEARYKAFADAEALLINNALVIPRGMSVPAYLATRLNYWEGQYASIGFSNKRLKGIHVLDHYISMDEYEANRDAR